VKTSWVFRCMVDWNAAARALTVVEKYTVDCSPHVKSTLLSRLFVPLDILPMDFTAFQRLYFASFLARRPAAEDAGQGKTRKGTLT